MTPEEFTEFEDSLSLEESNLDPAISLISAGLIPRPLGRKLVENLQIEECS